MLAERLDAVTEAISLAKRQDDRRGLFAGRLREALDLLEAADGTATANLIPAVFELAEELQTPREVRWARVIMGTRATIMGNFDEAEALVSEALDLGRRIDDDDAFSIYASQLFILRWHQGRMKELLAFADQIQDTADSYAPWKAGLAVLHAEVGDWEEAASALDALAEDGFSHVFRDRVWLVTMVLIGQLCFVLKDARRGAIVHKQLVPYAGRVGLGGLGGQACTGANARVIALLEDLLGRAGAAAHHFETALAVNGRIGAKPWVAQTKTDYARMLLVRREGSDVEQASVMLDDAERTAKTLGMMRLVGDVCALRMRL